MRWNWVIDPNRKYIAGEDICPGHLITVRKKWYQYHWRVYKVRSRKVNVAGIVTRSYNKGEEVDIIDRGQFIISGH